MKIRHLAALALLVVTSASQATVLDFNEKSDGQYWIGSTTSQSFTATTLETNGNIGLVTHVDGYGNSNGTVSLISWTNGDSDSGFTLAKNDLSLFSLNAFDFANGYPNFSSAVTSLDIIGTYANSSTTVQHFEAIWGSTDFATLTLNNSFSNLVSVNFIANGFYNRAVWDNIVVDEASHVAEPAPFLLLGLGLFGLGVARRNKKS